jgi:flavin reductase (DIM6/NTAB) family NADH-FMN oxidoreductase RutF
MALTKDEYRQLIGCFATGVTIITMAHGGEVRGMTANAVTSVSLDPLLLLICVDKRTITHQFLEQAETFAVNILAEDQEHVSRALASRDSEDARRLLGHPYHPGQTGSPILKIAWHTSNAGLPKYFPAETTPSSSGRWCGGRFYAMHPR